MPQKDAWKIEVLKPKDNWDPHMDADGETLFVDSHAPRDLYPSIKLDAYRRAIEAWNALDGSDRPRITEVQATPVLKDTTPEPVSADSVPHVSDSDLLGSQPTRGSQSTRGSSA